MASSHVSPGTWAERTVYRSGKSGRHSEISGDFKYAYGCLLYTSCEAVWQRGYSDSGCMLIMGRASAGRSQQLVCEYRDWYFFVQQEK